MELKITEIENKEIWEDFLRNVKEKTFLQSFNWGEFNKKMGDKILRLGIYENQELVSTSLVIKMKAKRGTFLLLSHAPSVFLDESGVKRKYEILKTLLEKLKEIGKEEKASFIRIAPIWKRNEENIEIFKRLGFREAPIHVHPELTWELDLGLSEEELLRNMRKTTRYLIRQGLKNEEIKIIKSNNIKDIEKFNNLYLATKTRHQFSPFSLNYLKNEFLSFLPDDQISLFLGEYKGEVVCSGIFVFWQNTCFYHHGASSLKYPKVPVSYLLLWEGIKEAKERGCQKFNFWGIAPISNKKHPWTGLSLFKMGFGGESKEYLKTQDFVISNSYWFSFFIEKLRKLKRGL